MEDNPFGNLFAKKEEEEKKKIGGADVELIKNHYPMVQDMVQFMVYSGCHEGEEALADLKKIAAYLCEAYGAEDVKERFLNQLPLIQEIIAIRFKEEKYAAFLEEDAFYYNDIINSTLLVINFFNEHSGPQMVATNRFDYVYNPARLYSRLIDLFRSDAFLLYHTLSGLMKACGIGTDECLESAAIRFRQGAYWGDALSIRLYKLTLKKLGKEKEAALWEEVWGLVCPALENSTTVISEEAQKGHSEEAVEIASLIAAVRVDVYGIRNFYYVDLSFVEALADESLSYSEKMDFINSYREEGWKTKTDSLVNQKKWGF